MTRTECYDEWLARGGIGTFYDGTSVEYGCIATGEDIYWVDGGTCEQVATDVLSGGGERVLCWASEAETNAGVIDCPVDETGGMFD